MGAEAGEGLPDMAPRNLGDIGTNNANRAGRQAVEHLFHPLAKISRALRNARQMRRPNAALQTFMIGRDAQNELPAGILQAPQQPARLVTKPPCSGGHTNITPEPGFDPPWPWFLDHDHQTSSVFRRNSHARSEYRSI
jgi:hypothetical protein